MLTMKIFTCKACDHIYTELGGPDTPAYDVCHKIFLHLVDMRNSHVIFNDFENEGGYCKTTLRFCVDK